MKLPDYIYLNINLPVSSSVQEDYIPAVRQFLRTDPLKTLDLVSALRFYEIDSDGQLYEVDRARFYGKSEAKRHPMKIDKVVGCYAKVFKNEEEDDFINISYSLTFKDGVLEQVRAKDYANEI
jgi:hypothetical protein